MQRRLETQERTSEHSQVPVPQKIWKNIKTDTPMSILAGLDFLHKPRETRCIRTQGSFENHIYRRIYSIPSSGFSCPPFCSFSASCLTMRRLKSRRIRPAHLEHRNRQQPKTRRTATKKRDKSTHTASTGTQYSRSKRP